MVFRKEAVNNKIWQGRAIAIRGAPFGLVMSVCILFIVALLVFSITGNYTRRIKVAGEISTYPRTVSLYSGVQGVVVEQFVRVGQNIKVGEAIYKIDVSKVSQSGVVSVNQRQEVKSQLARIEQIIQRLENSKKSTQEMLERQRMQYVAAYQRSTEILEHAQEGIRIAKKDMDNYRDYQRKGFINRDQLNSQVAIYYQQKNNLLNLSGQHEQNALQIITLENQLKIQSADYDNQIHQMELQRFERQKELLTIEANDSIVVRASSDGRVDSLSVTVGQMVNVGESLMQLLPNQVDFYALILWVPNHAVPYLLVGDRVNIHYEAFPTQKFGRFSGTVTLISKSPASQQEMLTWHGAPRSTLTESSPWYKVTVKPDKQSLFYAGREVSLENGMKAESTLFLETRRIYQWMFSPLYDLKQSAMGQIDG
jgi:membrane fusion protein